MQRSYLVLVAGVLLVMIGIAVVATLWQARSVQNRLRDEGLDIAQAAQTQWLQQRGDALRQVSSAIAGNGGMIAYIDRAMNAAHVDTHSIQEQLAERREGVGIDVLAIIDPKGRFIAGAGAGLPDGFDFSHDARFQEATNTIVATSGVWFVDERVYQVAYSPLVQGNALVAILLAGDRFDVRATQELASMSRAGHALVVPADKNARVASTSLGESDARALFALLDEHPELYRGAAASGSPAASDVALDNIAAVARVTPLTQIQPGAALLTFAPVAQGNRLERAMVLPMLAAFSSGLLVLALAFGWIWRSWVGPLVGLARLADHSAVGDYTMAFAPRGSEAVRLIGAALNRANAQLGRHRPQPGAPKRRATDRSQS